jgi:hypothetical protein
MNYLCIRLPDQWKESIVVPVYKKGDKTDCSKIYYKYKYKYNVNMLACYNEHLSSYNKYKHNAQAKQTHISNVNSTVVKSVQ